MIKRLDILVLRSFIGPFLASTFVMLLVLIFQFLWMFIDDLIGKGLSIWVLTKLILYISVTLLPLCLPTGMLFACLLSFGDMGEHFEIISIKAAGISFWRFLQPIVLIGLFVSAVAFGFANYLIPEANHRYTNLLWSIIMQKPAFNIREGMFYDKIDNYTIRAKAKSENGKILHDIIIIERNKDNNGYDNTIYAKQGSMKLTPNNNGLVFLLHNGYYYQEHPDKDYPQEKKYNQLFRVEFDSYERVLNVSGFGLNETPSQAKNYRAMRLDEIDQEIRNRNLNFYITPTYVQNTLVSRVGVLRYLDSPMRSLIHTHTGQTQIVDSLLAHKIKSAPATIATWQQARARFIQDLTETVNSYTADKERFIQTNRQLEVEWHKKFSLSFLCFIFGLIGSSLGAIIRKGGVGLPLIIAVSFFIFYYFTSSSLEKIATDSVQSLNAFWALWATNFFLLPVGVFLAYKVLNDTPVVRSERWGFLFAAIRGALSRWVGHFVGGLVRRVKT